MYEDCSDFQKPRGQVLPSKILETLFYRHILQKYKYNIKFGTDLPHCC